MMKKTEIREFADQYKKNIECEMIKAVCPKCKREYKIYPEHLGRATCGSCDIDLVEG